MTAPQAPSRGASKDMKVGLLATCVAVSAWGFSGVLIKSIEMDALAVAFWRFALFSVALLLWLWSRKTRITLRVLKLSAPGGLMLSADVILFFTAVRLTTVVNATTISALQPLVVGVFATRMFGEKISRHEMIAAAIAVAGVLTIVIESSGSPQWNGLGDLAALGTLFAWSGYFVMTRKARDLMTPIEFTFGTSAWTATACFATGLVARQDLSTPSGVNWMWIIVLVLVGGVLGHSLMNWSLSRIPLWLGSAMTLMIPVISSLAAWVLLDESLTAIQLVAMAVVVISLSTVVMSQRPAGDHAAGLKAEQTSPVTLTT